MGVPAFALIKVLSNFYFARDNTKLPFYISLVSMILNIIISVSLFKKYGFIIIPIATSVSTWIAVLIYFILLNKNKLINFGSKSLLNFLKILLATMLMCLFLYFGLDYFEDKFEYSYKFKLIYLLIMIGSSAAIYLFITKLLGILSLKSYKLK
jgi:putative peptidoglycan lipid II flippase